MNKLMKDPWMLCLLTFITIAWIVAFPLWRDWLSANPLDVPISLSPAGKVEQMIEIRMPAKYDLSLIFVREGQSFEKLKSLIGAGHICQRNEPCSEGIPVRVKWSLRNRQYGIDTVNGDVISQNAHGWSNPQIERRITSIKIEAGYYIFKAEIVHSVPEFESIRTRIGILFRESEAWQDGLLWWGSMFTYCVMWPIMLLMLFSTIKIICWPN
jgi:hypothetical protein